MTGSDETAAGSFYSIFACQTVNETGGGGEGTKVASGESKKLQTTRAMRLAGDRLPTKLSGLVAFPLVDLISLIRRLLHCRCDRGSVMYIAKKKNPHKWLPVSC